MKHFFEIAVKDASRIILIVMGKLFWFPCLTGHKHLQDVISTLQEVHKDFLPPMQIELILHLLGEVLQVSG
jgi:hypothetical protein